VAQKIDDLRAALENPARLLVDDQIHVPLAVALLAVGEAVVFVRQRSQRLGEQLVLLHQHIEVTAPGLVQGSPYPDQVADVPLAPVLGDIALYSLVGIELNPAGHVLQHQKGSAPGHDATGDADPVILRLQLFLAQRPVILLQLQCEVVAAEGIGKGFALLAQPGEPGAALGDQFVLFTGVGNIAHRTARDQRPALRLASIKGSSAPSSTPWVLRVSTPVRRSLMRASSST